MAARTLPQAWAASTLTLVRVEVVGSAVAGLRADDELVFRLVVDLSARGSNAWAAAGRTISAAMAPRTIRRTPQP
jgi:hypothetical protein